MRIQLEVPGAMEGRLKQWMNEVGFKTYSDLFNNTMSLFTWVANEVKNGRIIVSLDPGGQGYERQLSMPFMDALSPAHNPAAAPKPDDRIAASAAAPQGA